MYIELVGAGYSLARPIYELSSVLILIFSPVSMNSGTCHTTRKESWWVVMMIIGCSFVRRLPVVELHTHTTPPHTPHARARGGPYVQNKPSFHRCWFTAATLGCVALHPRVCLRDLKDHRVRKVHVDNLFARTRWMVRFGSAGTDFLRSAYATRTDPLGLHYRPVSDCMHQRCKMQSWCSQFDSGRHAGTGSSIQVDTLVQWYRQFGTGRHAGTGSSVQVGNASRRGGRTWPFHL